ncbi:MULTISPECIES: virulence factor BrkB family protein [unclassified Gilliamella]|uniref:virulence factor BrkB family protein n=1 Tax=unclassified Gilliamella TaxID=2685620 RepID=UPI00226A8D98|nr:MULTISPECIES: virulence factor BrkB family protein [unclassified Gilliamella]MCX8575004.1 virulence factor BrkB family protein [Gilliamella sp. B3831]MCX8577386.1 virulence factor BrkB family protein [Gilliamella sp. B3815]MCX8579510.1 virulence factor BrkB family protein [Gilliamella sp. B2717]MCX8588761.1 virulence factor BrkB family protein [Gilliamella sp. B3801]MCX8590102.1 virulence factor BrkB family protein [Gilliamella sp. B3812]
MKTFQQITLFLKMLWAKINQDQLTTSSASLAYTTILALVPLITVIFSLLSAFPMFDEISLSLKQLIYSNLVPTASDTIQNYLEQFITNTKKMTVVGIVGLIVTSLLLINSINSALNHIWRTKRKRSFMYNLTMYWTILTLGPILAGSSVAVSSYIFSLNWLSTGATGNIMLSSLPFIISVVGFWLLYSIIPTESVPFKESFIGAIVAAILFEIGKRAFAFYVSSFPTYQLIYGVVSSIPIMLVWIYCSWCIVLFGAEFAATLTEFNRPKKRISDNQAQAE